MTKIGTKKGVDPLKECGVEKYWTEKFSMYLL